MGAISQASGQLADDHVSHSACPFSYLLSLFRYVPAGHSCIHSSKPLVPYNRLGGLLVRVNADHVQGALKVGLRIVFECHFGVIPRALKMGPQNGYTHVVSHADARIYMP